MPLAREQTINITTNDIMPKEVVICLIPACGRMAEAEKRGLCMRCYATARRFIVNGKTTWEQLVNAGLASPEVDPFTAAFNKLNATTLLEK